MSIISSLFNAGSSIVATTVHGILVVTRVAIVSSISTSCALAAAVVQETNIAARQIRDDPNTTFLIETGKAGYTAGMTKVRNTAAAIEAAAFDFEARHKN